MKKLTFFCLAYFTLVALPCFASSPPSSCPKLTNPTDSPAFCGEFKSIAVCHCVEAHIPSGMCQDMNTIYQRMIGTFGSVEKACEYQSDTSVQECMDDWTCYRTGGTDSQGRVCNGTGKPCE